MARIKQTAHQAASDCGINDAAHPAHCNHSPTSSTPPTPDLLPQVKPALPIFPLEVWTPILLHFESPHLLVQTSKAFYYTLGQDSHVRSKYLQHRFGKLSLFYAVLLPNLRPLLTVNLTTILLNSGALLPRYLVQKAHQLPHSAAGLNEPQLKNDILAIICQRGHLLYGDNLLDGPDDCTNFEEWVVEFGYCKPYGRPPSHLEDLNDLVHKYSFVIHPLPDSGKWLNTYLYHMMADSEHHHVLLSWLDHMSASGFDKAAFINTINHSTMMKVLKNGQCAFAEFLCSVGLSITPALAQECIPHLLHSDRNGMLLPLFHLLKAHLPHSLLAELIATEMVSRSTKLTLSYINPGKYCDLYHISPKLYTTLRTHLPTFDTHLASLLPIPSSMDNLPKTSSLQQTILKLGIPSTLTTYYFEAMFCNGCHDVPDTQTYATRMQTYNKTFGKGILNQMDWLIPSMLRDGFQMKPWYTPWVVWRFGGRRDWESDRGHKFEDTALDVVQPLLDQVVGVIRKCEEEGDLKEWERHIRRAIEVVDVMRASWDANAQHTQGADFSLSVNDSIRVQKHLRRCQNELERVLRGIKKQVRARGGETA
ncbi:hypothetical protein HDV00_003400 [Rhizophlyctis rosea]|nr:hypothetical protein HDV00_003400 [Rhizophlyctis rosea]